MFVAAVLVYSILPNFSYITGVPISHYQWSTPGIWLGALALFVTGSVVTGMYPAWPLVTARSLATAKANYSRSKYGVSFRKTLTVVQFTGSISLIAFVLVISDQINFMRLSSKGVDIDQVIAVRNPTVYANDDSVNFVEFQTFGNQLRRDSKVKQVTSSSAIPGMEVEETFTNRLKMKLTDPYDPTGYKILFVDYSFVPFYDLKLKAGRNYSPESGDDENWNTVILNESAIYALGFNSATEAKDQEVNLHLWGDDFKKYKIVGVLEDYHHEAIKRPVHPTIYSLNHSQFQQVFYAVKLHSGTDPREGLAVVERCWKNVFPDKPFEYFFQDDYYDRQFKSELHFGRIFGLFAGVATFIACMGIMGVTLFETNARLKEISIRKLLGATIASLIALLSKSNLRLIMISGAIGYPIIYSCSWWWLNGYPSRIELGPAIFLSPVIAVVVLVSLTSGFQMIRTVLSNPVDQLKHD
ncbi:MAG TPA: FtsX-like permease family protein [Chryseolinea sp.]|nr:FtsX-like permease family protein [Chryseolinea sp.]